LEKETFRHHSQTRKAKKSLPSADIPLSHPAFSLHAQSKTNYMQTKTVIGVVFWVLLAAFIIPGFIFGFQKPFALRQKVDSFRRWGYSLMFMRFLGLGEIVALTTLLFAQLRYAIIIFFLHYFARRGVHAYLRQSRKQVMTPVYML
jgi:membrane protease YdiL (CAAX protease family)